MAYNIHRRTDQLVLEQKLFNSLLWTDAVLIILDSFMWVLDGLPGNIAYVTHVASTALYYILNPVICLLWYCYVDYYIFRDTTRLKKRLNVMVIPVIINCVLTVASLFGNVLFYIDGQNIYHRGHLFSVMVAIALFYLVFTLVLSVLRQKLIRKKDFAPIVVFMIPPFIGGGIQILFYGTSLIWQSVTLSILIVYITIQNNQLYTDHLTGLYNRRHLDRYLQNRLQSDHGELLAGLMIDMDSFKSINDQYGHTVGDQALVCTSEILKKTFRKNDFIARYGGDEFVIIMSLQKKDDLQKAIHRLNHNVALFNEQRTAPYIIKLSIGYDCYLYQSDTGATEFLKRLDELMYMNKQHSADKS